MVNMGELFAYDRIRDQHMERVPLSDREAEKFLLKEGDLLFARASLTLEGSGKCAIVYPAANERTFESHIIRVRLDKERASSLFYYYFFRSPDGRAAIQSITEQVSAAGIRATDLARLPVPIPSPAEQRRIAAILGSLDDKIELNRRMNRTLERMAQALFKSWFIDFDPVRAKAEGDPTTGGLPDHLAALFPDRLTDSDLGPIPEGWKKGSLSSLATLQAKTIKPSNEPTTLWEHYSIPAYDEGQEPKLERGETIKSGKYAVSGDCVLVSKLNPQFQRIWLPWVGDERVAICSTEFMPFVACRRSWRAYLYEFMKSRIVQEAIEARISGSTGSRQRVKPTEIAELPVAMPHEDIIDRFCECVSPLQMRVLLNRRQNLTLVGLRDTLLPKLLSGELEVPAAEGLIEGVA